MFSIYPMVGTNVTFAAYIILLVPSTIARLMYITGLSTSLGSMVFAMVVELLFGAPIMICVLVVLLTLVLLGLASVFALVSVLRVLGPAVGTSGPSSRSPDSESFGNVQAKLSPMEDAKATEPEYTISPRAFPPPKRSFDSLRSPPAKYLQSAPSITGSDILGGHSRHSSIADSTTRLIAPIARFAHTPTGSITSIDTLQSLQRPMATPDLDAAMSSRSSSPALSSSNFSRRDGPQQSHRKPSVVGKSPRIPIGLPPTPRLGPTPPPKAVISEATLSPKPSSSSSLRNLYSPKSTVNEPAQAVPGPHRRPTIVKRVNFSLPSSFDESSAGEQTVTGTVPHTTPPRQTEDSLRQDALRDPKYDDIMSDSSDTPSSRMSLAHTANSGINPPPTRLKISAASKESSSHAGMDSDIAASLAFASLVATAATSDSTTPGNVHSSSSHMHQTTWSNSAESAAHPVPSVLQPRLPRSGPLRREPSYAFRSNRRQLSGDSVYTITSSSSLDEQSLSSITGSTVVAADVHATVREVRSTTPRMENAASLIGRRSHRGRALPSPYQRSRSAGSGGRSRPHGYL